MSFASLQLYFFRALAETTPSNTNLVSLPVIPGIIFARCARVSICSPNVIGSSFFFFSPPSPSLFRMSANTVMHTVSARSNCEPGSISIFSSAGSGPASVNRWTSLQAACPSMAYSPSGSPLSLKSQPLFYFEHDVFSLHVSRFDYVSMTLLRNLILKWAFQYIGHREHLVHMHKVQSFLVGIWHKASVTFSYILSILKKKLGLEE